jgi:hypothetical protein
MFGAMRRMVSSSRAQLLQKKDDDVVITFAKRTAMGRAKKGQLKDVSVDELLHALFKVLAVVLLTHLLLLIHIAGSGNSREDRVEPFGDWRHLCRYAHMCLR